MLTDRDKEYRAVMLLGVTTDTQDVTGEVLKESSVEASEKDVRQAVMKFAVKAMADASELVLEKAGLTMDDIALVVPHQANYRIVDSAIKRMGIGEDKVFLNLSKYGNTSGSCIPVALSQAVEQGRAKKGDKLILVGFGGGLTWGALIVQL